MTCESRLTQVIAILEKLKEEEEGKNRINTMCNHPEDRRCIRSMDNPNPCKDCVLMNVETIQAEIDKLKLLIPYYEALNVINE